jgi:glutamate synthase (NADPH/NADH) small chain
VRFEWLAAPERLDGPHLIASRMRLGAADASGRRNVEQAQGGFELAAQMVIVAAGFDPELLGEPGLTVAPDGRIKIGRFQTSLDGVFAAGDVVRGASLVVWAIRDGRDAAAAIHAHFLAKQEHRHAAE